jgi:hypothetical protein
VAIGTDQAEVIQFVIRGIAVNVIQLQRRRLAHPFRNPADFAFSFSDIQQIGFEKAGISIASRKFSLSDEFMLAIKRAVNIWSLPHERTTIQTLRFGFCRPWHPHPTFTFQIKSLEPISNGCIRNSSGSGNTSNTVMLFGKPFQLWPFHC